MNKIFNKSGVAMVLVLMLAVGFTLPITAEAATAPDLGAAADYSVFGKAGVTNTGAGTHVWGSAGADASNVTGLIASQVDGVINAGSGVEAAILSAYGQLASQGADGAVSLSGIKTVTPGVYTVSAAEVLNGTVTLDGAGVYVFRSGSAFTVASGAEVLLTNGATACDVFWQIPSAMTIGTNATMVGTIIANTELISLASGATLEGRALSRIAQVTLDNNQITEPTCETPPPATPPATPPASPMATLHVVKNVINNSGGTADASLFNLHVKLSGTDVAGSPATGIGAPGTSYTLAPGTYVVSEDANTSYTTSFSGACNSSGSVTLSADDDVVCTVTNNDIEATVIIPPPAPVPVVAPTLPRTGFPPKEDNASWTVVISEFLLNYSHSLGF